MRSLAIKIFLSFWLAQVVILVGLEIMRPRRPGLPEPPPSPVFIPTPVLIAAVIVSAAVCFLLARYLTSPLRRVREASSRLASGDLGARAGALMRPRRDEIGDVVRDFDVMAERLSLLVSSQKQLLSDISHELRSPLARLQVAVELARRKAGPDAEKHLNRIEVEGTRMNEMIGQILALARADSDRPAITERVDLAEIVRSVAADTDYEARQTDREVHVTTRGGGHRPRRRGVADKRRRKCRPQRNPLHAAWHFRRHLARGNADPCPHCRARPRAGRSAGRRRANLSAVPPRRRLARPRLRRRRVGAVDCGARREGSRRVHSRRQRGRRRPASDDLDPSRLSGFPRFTKLYVRFRFLDGTRRAARLLW